jgi:hypothetical protein
MTPFRCPDGRCRSLFLVLRVIALATNGHDLFVDEAQYGAWARGLEAGYCSKPPMLA